MGNTTRLKAHVDKIERLMVEAAEVAAQIKEAKAEAKSDGYSVGILNTVLKRRAWSAERRDEFDALINLYEADLGMLGGKPLNEAALRRLERLEEEAAQASLPLGDDADQPKADPDHEALYAQAVFFVLRKRNPSTSFVQRHLRIGYNLAAALVERMEREGVVSAIDHSGKREITKGADEIAPLVEIFGAAGFPAATDPVQEESEDTEDEARNKGAEAAQTGMGVLQNPYPPRSMQRAAWEEAWCQAKNSDGMEIPDAFKPTPRPKAVKPPEDAADGADGADGAGGGA